MSSSPEDDLTVGCSSVSTLLYSASSLAAICSSNSLRCISVIALIRSVIDSFSRATALSRSSIISFSNSDFSGLRFSSVLISNSLAVEGSNLAFTTLILGCFGLPSITGVRLPPPLIGELVLINAGSVSASVF